MHIYYIEKVVPVFALVLDALFHDPYLNSKPILILSSVTSSKKEKLTAGLKEGIKKIAINSEVKELKIYRFTNW